MEVVLPRHAARRRRSTIDVASSPAAILLPTCCLHLVVIATAVAFARASEISQLPQASLQQCCTDQRMTAPCADELCALHSATNASPISLSCYFDVDKVFRCLSGRRNASSCCQTQRVPRRCGHLCTGHSGQLMVSDIHCLQHLPAIARCFHDVFVRDDVPGPAVNLTVTSVTSASVLLTWSAPSFNADSLLYYTVQYRSRDSYVIGNINNTLKTTVEERLTVSDLLPATLYEASVISVGVKGTSWPSTPVTFMTYPLSNPDGHSRHVATSNISSQQQHPELQSEPRELVVSNRSQHSLRLSWKLPAFTVHPVSSYRIQYRQMDAGSHPDTHKWDMVTVSGRQTEVILQNLIADSEYSVIVTAVSDSSAGPPSPVISVRTLQDSTVKQVAVMRDLTACCRQHNVSSSCIAACAGSDVIDTRTCAQELIKIIACAADGKNHTDCCYRKAVPYPCHGYCTGHSLNTNLQAFLCLAYTDEIFSCFREDSGRLANSPERFELVDMGFTSATFSWLSDTLTDSQLTYRLHYKSSSDEVYSFIEDVRSPHTLQGLVPSSTYSVYVVAVNQFGVSDPSAIISFHLLSPETGSVRIVQSPPGFAPLGARLLLSCSYTAGRRRPAKVSWLRGRQRVEGRWFVIESVRREDDGRYTCVVDTSGHVLSADAVVRVQFSPTATALERYVQAGVGHTAHLVCRFTGHPDSISWYHGRTGAPVVGSRYSVTRYILEDVGVVDSRLSIDRVTRRDYGSYRCKASNIYSTADALISLAGLDVSPAGPPTTSYTTLQPPMINCCREQGVARQCLAGCSGGVRLSSIRNLDSGCAIDLPKILHCAAGGVNHTTCCTLESVPEYCLPLCSGDVVSSAVNISCLSHVDNIVNCLQQTLANTPSQPENVRLSMTSSGKVLVVWNVPKVNSNLVEFYRINYTAERAGQTRANSSLTVSVHERSVILTDVEAFTTYDVIVAAGNRDVISLPSVPAHITTFELAPSAPWRVTGELIGGVNVRLSWRAPRQYSLFVTAYLVFYASTSEVSSTNTPAIRKVDGRSHDCTVEQLASNTRYVFYVTAMSAHYQSDESNKVVVSTTDAVKSVTSPPAEFRHKVALAVCLVLLCAATVVFVVIARRYCCVRALKRKARRTAPNESVSFDNLNYSRLSDCHDASTVRWSVESTNGTNKSSTAVNRTQQQQQQQLRLRENGCQNC